MDLESAPALSRLAFAGSASPERVANMPHVASLTLWAMEQAQDNDEDLMLRYQAGDAAAFDRL